MESFTTLVRYLKEIFETWKNFWQSKKETLPEPERKDLSQDDQKLLWCPFAEKVKPMKSQGKYAKNYPVGAVVHWTAGSSASSSLDYGREQGYLFWMIDKAGKIYQPNPLNEWGYHAGQSKWEGLGESVSKHLVGIEIDCAGNMTPYPPGKFKSWFGRIVDGSRVRTVDKKDNMAAGHYEKFTPEQEESLNHLIEWLYKNNRAVFNLDYVLGHDEISPGRKIDPGGSLSMTMPEFRKLLKEKLK